MTGILGKKLGMTRLLQDDGCVIPVTVLHCEPNEVAQVKTVEKDGYPALVLGFSKLKKPTKTKKFKTLREFKIAKEDTEKFKVGDLITVAALEGVEKVSVTSMSKGKGFQGVVKRWNFSGGPESHGSHFHREPGSIGTRAKPGRVHRGKKLAGHMGFEQVTLNRVKVALIDNEKNIICVKGSVPGGNGQIVTIRS